MPSYTNAKAICTPKDLTPLSPFWIQRNHHKWGQEEMIHQMKFFFKLPWKEGQKETTITEFQFECFCFLTQCVQALCVKAQTEHYRRLRSTKANCMGALYWQCNDIWQAPTWSSIEYNGSWKVLHYFVKEFFSPLLISSFENEKGEYQLVICNDLTRSIQGIIFSFAIFSLNRK